LGGGRKAAASQAAEKRFLAVVLSEAKNLALRIFMEMRDSLSPAAPQNDNSHGFFRSLFSPAETAASALGSSRAAATTGSYPRQIQIAA